MEKVDLSIFQVKRTDSIKDAMKQMDLAAEKILFVTENEKLIGSLTDGDIRRWILKEGKLEESVGKIYNKNPLVVKKPYEVDDVKKMMLKNKIETIPVVDASKKLVEILLWKEVFGGGVTLSRKKLDVPVVIMAGGKGTRLDPFTKVLPKPLIPIGDKTIIEIIMEKFALHGVHNFYVTINHKAKMIKSYFEETNSKYVINYIEEDTPLGTAGSLRLLKDKINGPLLVSNCDIIIDCDYNEIVKFHDENNYDITIVGSFRHFTIPYGICEMGKDGMLKGMQEKPEYDYLVNTGMCVIAKKVFEFIPEGEIFHITDLVKSVCDNDGKVGVFPISEKSWIDVGRWEEYHNSVKLMGIE